MSRDALAGSVRRMLTLYAPLLAVAVGWFVARLAGVRSLSFLNWLPGTLGLVLAAGFFFRAARTADLAPAGRRLWRTLAVAALCIAPTIHPLTDANLRGTAFSPVLLGAVCLLVVALLLVLVGLFRLPVNTRTAGDRLRLGLDAATVLICAVAFLWQFVFEPQVRLEVNVPKVLGLLSVSVLCLMAVLAVVKLMLAGTDAVDPVALRCLTVVVLVGAVGAAIVPLLAAPRLSGASDIFTTMEGLSAATAGAIQTARSGRVAGIRRARRPYSIVPYLAIGGIDVLLLVTTANGSRTLPIVVAAVGATGIVVARQWLAFHDNDALLRSVREHQELLRHQATHDSLTGLPNRALFNDRLDEALRPAHAPVTAMLIDLDDFKAVNDTLGHPVGDGLLVEVARRLRAAVREHDVVARLGGDEFAVLLPDHGAAPVEVARRILAELEPPVLTHGHRLRVGASVGLAERGPDDDGQRLLQHADIAMYTAKRLGKGRYSKYADEPVDSEVRSFV